MVSIVAFQAVDRGSIPRCRIIFLQQTKKKKRKKKKKKRYVRSGIRTHAHIHGPESPQPLW